MVEGNASMYLGSPRMAEMVIGEKVTLEEMGGAKMHCSVSGCGDVLVKTEDEAIAFAQALPRATCRRTATSRRRRRGRAPPKPSGKPLEEIIPADENKPFDMMAVIDEIIDEGSLVRDQEALRAARSSPASRASTGASVGIVANQPKWLGGVLFVDSRRQGRALHLAVRRVQRPAALPRRRARLHDRHQGRAAGHHPRRREDDRRGERGDGARRSASSCARRTARASTRCAARRSSPTRASRCRRASIAVMGPQAAVNAVYYNKIQEVPEGPERDALRGEAARRVPRATSTS